MKIKNLGHVGAIWQLCRVLFVIVCRFSRERWKDQLISTSPTVLGFWRWISITVHLVSLSGNSCTTCHKSLFWIHRMSQEECARRREGVPYVKIYRYNPKHLCPKLNGYGDKGQRKVCSFAVPRTVPGSRDVIPIRCALSVLVYSRLKRVPRCDCTCKVLGNPRDNYDMSASVFVVQFNGFMSLTS